MMTRKAITIVAMKRKGLYRLMSFHVDRGNILDAHEDVDGQEAELLPSLVWKVFETEGSSFSRHSS